LVLRDCLLRLLHLYTMWSRSRR